MRWFLLPINPVVLMVVCGTLAAAQFSLGELLRERQLSLNNTRTSLELALSETQLAIGARITGLVADTALSRHLDWQLSHSVRGTLESRLAPGEVDRLVIVGDGCKELVQVGKGPHIDCANAQKAANAGLASAFNSGDREDFERLALALRIGNSLLVGDVVLNDIWLGRHPSLKKQLEQSGLQLERNQTELAGNAIVVGQTSGLRLVSKQALDRFFQLDTKTQSFTGGKPQFLNPLFWPTICAGLICAALAALNSWRQRLRLLHLIRDHGEAILKSEQTHFRSKTAAAEATLNAVCSHVQNLNKQTQAEQQALREQLAIAENNQRAANDARQALEERLAAQIGFESLAAQLQAATRPFLQRIQHLRELAENLRDITNAGVTQTAHLLAQQISVWQSNIAERGSRKFIRSLAETASVLRHEASALDDELHQLLQLSDRLKDQSLHINLSSQALLRESEETIKLASHWQALADGATDRERPIQMAEALAEAYTLAEASGISMISFDTGDAGSTSPRLPAQTAVSALYHLLVGFASQYTNGLRLACRMRQEQGRSLMIFSPQGDRPDQSIMRSEEQNKHFETASTLLAPHGITLIVLPTRTGASPIALRWDDTPRFSVVDSNQLLCLSAQTQ